MNAQMELFNKGEFADLYRNIREDEGMMAVMNQMQKPYGVSERKAYENADAVIRLVAAHKNLSNMLSEDALEVLDTFLKDSEKMSGYDRKVLLHQLYFGLRVCQDEALIEQVKEGTGEGALFREYYTRCGEDPSVTAEMLEDEIRKLMGNYRVSPEAMRVIVRQMEKSQDLRATASALGRAGMRFKCIAALDLYLRNQDTMTMDQAVNIACTNVQLQAAADGVSRGLITEERARKIIFAVAVASILCSIALAMYAPQLINLAVYADAIGEYEAVNALLAKHAAVTTAKEWFFIGGVTIPLISDKVAEWIGRIAGGRSYIRHAEAVNTAEAMESMIDRMEAEAAETVADSAMGEAFKTAHQKKAATVLA